MGGQGRVMLAPGDRKSGDLERSKSANIEKEESK